MHTKHILFFSSCSSFFSSFFFVTLQFVFEYFTFLFEAWIVSVPPFRKSIGRTVQQQGQRDMDGPTLLGCPTTPQHL